jgi:protein-export membrane protein SecD
VPLLILAIGLLACYVDFMPGPKGLGDGARFFNLSTIDGGIGQKLETKLGLDLQGGYEVKYGAVDTAGKPAYPSSQQMEVIRTIIENRVNSTGVSEPIVETAGSNEILVQVPGATDPSQIENLVGQTGKLEFVLLPPDQYGDNTGSLTCPTLSSGCKAVPTEGQAIDPSLPVQFTGDQLDSTKISAAVDSSSTSNWLVNFAFSGSNASAFATWTGDHVNDYFAIVLDGTVQSAPYIKSAITGGQGQISGTFTVAQAKQLATILSYGALPYPVMKESSQDIPATLGKTFMDQTLFAGAIGIGLVLLFMLIYYRLPGLVACLALIYYSIAVYAVFRIIPVTLTLAGIAAFVISVGMAVDANILIFERTKEELRAGKTLATAVEAGFSRAWNSIFDSNVSSLITAMILYFGGSSTIKGFALVLIIGVATSMFTAVTVSRTLLRFVVRQGMAQKAWMYGVSDEEFQARSMSGRLGRREARSRV